MDKSWMAAKKWSNEYVQGCKGFMKFVEEHMGQECDIRCPCIDCLNSSIKSQNSVYEDILLRGIDVNYVRWIYHGERSEFKFPNHNHVDDGNEANDDTITYSIVEDDGMHDMFADLESYMHNQTGTTSDGNNHGDVDEGAPGAFSKLLTEAQRELYPGCPESSRLSFLVKLLHVKVYNKWSNKSLDMLLKVLNRVLPDVTKLPKSHYEIKTVLQDLGLGYSPIHACKYDCVLFWKEFKDRQECPVCNTSRWKVDNGKRKKVPHKILRYFPLIPRLQRLFMSRKTAEDIRWHKEKHVNDGEVLRHPADAKAWKDFERLS